MNKPVRYEAFVQYDSGPISLLDRNIFRIAKNYGGTICGDSFELDAERQHRRLAYSFEAKGKRRRFIAAVQKFVGKSDFGVSVLVE